MFARVSALCFGLLASMCCTILRGVWGNVPSSSHGTGAHLRITDKKVRTTEASSLLTLEIDRELSGGVVSGTHSGWRPRKQAHVPPLDNTAKPTLAAFSQTELVDWIVASPPNDTLPQSPAQLLPSPGISTVARRPPRPPLNTPSAGFHVNMQLKESHRPQAGHHGCPIRPPPAFSSSISSSPLLLVSPVVCCPACPHRALFPLPAVSFSLLIQDCVSHTAHTISPFSLLASRSKPLSAI